MQFVTPDQVFDAIKHAGDNAFMIDNEARTSRGATFRSFKILKKIDDKWEYVPLNLRFVNLPLKGKIRYDNGYDKAQILFRESSSAVGCGDYGKAKCAIADAFVKLAHKHLAMLSAPHLTHKIISNVQKNGSDGMPLPDSYVRVKIPTDGINFDIDIYDVTKPKVNGQWPHLVARDGVRVNYNNVNSVIKVGSLLNGIDCMSAVCVSDHGISLPSRVTILLVNPKTGRNQTPEEAWNDVNIYTDDQYHFDECE